MLKCFFCIQLSSDRLGSKTEISIRCPDAAVGMQVSQFTLYALAKGNKPDYHLAMPPAMVHNCPLMHDEERGLRCSAGGVFRRCGAIVCDPALIDIKSQLSVQAKVYYLGFLERLRSEYVAERVQDGIFGAMMDVSLVNDVSPAAMTVTQGSLRCI